MPPVFPLARNPAGPAPVRRPGSVRRTSTIDTSWPEGMTGSMLMRGHARDVWTPLEGGDPRVLAEDRFTITASPAREILSIETWPNRPAAQQLVGVRGGGQSRKALAEIMATDREAGTPLYLILDDYAGASLVAGWVWSLWVADWRAQMEKAGPQSGAPRRGSMEGVCTGFAPGSSALNRDNGSDIGVPSRTPVLSLINPDDPLGWHGLAIQDGVGMRRARRIDVWRDGEDLAIDVGFQDSGTSPDGPGRIAIHEYQVTARATGEPLTLTELNTRAHILPFPECPGAVANARRMLGAPLLDMRARVLETLPGTLGCTHLNDVLRSMAETPQLAAYLAVRR